MYLILMGIGLIAIGFLMSKPNKSRLEFLQVAEQHHESDKTSTSKAINFKALTNEPLLSRIKTGLNNRKAQLGKYLALKLALFFALTIIVTLGLKLYLFDVPFFALYPITLAIMIFMALSVLQNLERKEFNQTFPDALNLLKGAISSGDSLMHAVIFVGNSLDGNVGREFKLMGQRLSLGQSPDQVFSKSCLRFPYPAFYFFVITLRANINRGGQLKDIISKLNRVMFNSRALDKKKYAMTSEARASAKIVAAIPLCFFLIMKYMSPENYDFVMNDVSGRPILYYVLVSEVIGLGIIWSLMRGVRG